MDSRWPTLKIKQKRNKKYNIQGSLLKFVTSFPKGEKNSVHIQHMRIFNRVKIQNLASVHFSIIMRTREQETNILSSYLNKEEYLTSTKQ